MFAKPGNTHAHCIGGCEREGKVPIGSVRRPDKNKFLVAGSFSLKLPTKEPEQCCSYPICKQFPLPQVRVTYFRFLNTNGTGRTSLRSGRRACPRSCTVAEPKSVGFIDPTIICMRYKATGRDARSTREQACIPGKRSSGAPLMPDHAPCGGHSSSRYSFHVSSRQVSA